MGLDWIALRSGYGRLLRRVRGLLGDLREGGSRMRSGMRTRWSGDRRHRLARESRWIRERRRGLRGSRRPLLFLLSLLLIARIRRHNGIVRRVNVLAHMVAGTWERGGTQRATVVLGKESSLFNVREEARVGLVRDRVVVNLCTSAHCYRNQQVAYLWRDCSACSVSAQWLDRRVLRHIVSRRCSPVERATRKRLL